MRDMVLDYGLCKRSACRQTEDVPVADVFATCNLTVVCAGMLTTNDADIGIDVMAELLLAPIVAAPVELEPEMKPTDV